MRPRSYVVTTDAQNNLINKKFTRIGKNYFSKLIGWQARDNIIQHLKCDNKNTVNKCESSI